MYRGVDMKPRLRIFGSRIIYAIKLKRLLLFLAVLVFCITNVAVTLSVQQAVLPIVKNRAEISAKRHAVTAIYNAVQSVIEKDGYTYSDFYTICRTTDGAISSVEVNTTAVNTFKTAIAAQITSDIGSIESNKTGVPLGDVFNHLIFSGHGPVIPFTLSCSGFTSAEICSNFSSAGINQTKHSVSIDIKTEVSLVLPYDIMNVSVETEVPVTETVIVGNVPNIITSRNGV